jgi:superfamily II DNA or RNA helicase
LATLANYYQEYGSRISQDSEKLFVDDFLYPLLGSKIMEIIPQSPFIDRTGKSRRMDFAYHGPKSKIALEVNGETYHAEGIIPDEMFDDNLFRQNEILRLGYHLVRFSYSQLQSPRWRPIIQETLRETFRSHAPELLSEYTLEPTPLQKEALDALTYYRDKRGWQKGILVMPTGTGKTILSALDARHCGGKVLFLVHRLDILKQSIEAYKFVWPNMNPGILTGEVRENISECDVLFASKDTLRKPDVLSEFNRNHFNYIVVDEVHHGQSPTYREVISYFQPSFMIGMTATPDRTDRRDIFELFDYNKIYEIPLSEAIERGFLVPFTYYGFTDDIDYTRIRYQNNRYRVDDLERFLIIPERNEAILKRYLDEGAGDKAIGFCVSIMHTERMAKFFQERGILAEAVHSQSQNRDEIIAQFGEDKLQVVFTVDLFNEGIDFPNVRVLLFLRPTESKTVFLQQLGRGLRLCTGKERVRVLDFIGNYKRANQIRKYLAKDSKGTETKEDGKRRRKVEYIYSTGCEVHFDKEVEELLDNQDVQDLGITKEDLKEAYYTLAEKLERKPSRNELDELGEYKSAQYARLFGSWVGFLREIGEYTEASYHYPQGTHLGHVLSILKVFGSSQRQGTHFDDNYIRLRGGLGEGRISTYRRQVKYKLQAAMELGILPDDRDYAQDEEYPLELTPFGKELYVALKPVMDTLDLSFPLGDDGIPGTRMHQPEADYGEVIRNHISTSVEARKIVFGLLNMHAVQQMMAFLYHICRVPEIPRRQIYEQFFQAPFVRQYCDQEGIDIATEEAAKRRCPFLLNILDACGIITAQRQEIIVNKLVLTPYLVRPYQREEREKSIARFKAVIEAWPATPSTLDDEDLSIVRELFGREFLTEDYYLKELEVVKE